MPRSRRRPARPGALNDFAPARILGQIALLQLGYYGVGAALIVFTTLVAGKRLSLDLLLSWRSVRGDVTTGWTLALCWMMDALICVIFLLLLVARSKLVPDFALTIHFLHLLVVSLYTRSFPTQLFWWGLQVASAALMTILGMWACQWRELKPINFGGQKSNGAPVNGGSGSTTNGIPLAEDSVALLPTGGGGGRAGGHAGGGVYEMMGLKPKDDKV